MNTKRYTLSMAVAALAGTAALLAGCTGTMPGNAQPTSGSGGSSASDSGLPSDGAPKVQNPLDTSKFQAAMCSVLTKNQLGELGIREPGQAEHGAGPDCSWTAKHNGEAAPGEFKSITATVVTANTRGLSTLYQQKPDLSIFNPLGDIDGYPAVRYDESSKPMAGSCDIAVGVTDALDFSFDSDSEPGGSTDPCAVTKKIAGMVVSTLKGGS